MTASGGHVAGTGMPALDARADFQRALSGPPVTRT